MVSNALYSVINLDISQMDYSDDEETTKTAHHNITVELKEIACSPIPNICSYGIKHFQELIDTKRYNRDEYMENINKSIIGHEYTNEEFEDIVEKLEASRGYTKQGIVDHLKKIEKHHGYNKSQMTKILEKLNEADQYAILHYATTFNNVPFCQIIIENYGCHVNLIGWDGETPLHIAARLTDINKPNQTIDSSILLYLLNQSKVNKDIRDSEGRTPLHLAIMYNCYENAKYLISSGVKCDIGDIQGAIPLHYACRFHPNIDLIRLFLNEPKLFECETKDKKRPIDIAAEYGNLDILKHFFEIEELRIINRNDIKKGTATLINAAVRHREDEVLSFLKRQYQHILHPHLNTLHFACRQLHGHKMVSHLINKHSIMYQDKYTGSSPLMIAIQHRQIECVKELLSHKECTQNVIDLVSYITLRTAFHFCAEANEKEITKLLCQAHYMTKILVLAVDILGDTPLHICAKVGNAFMIKILLDYIKQISSSMNIISYSSTSSNIKNLNNNNRIPLKLLSDKHSDINRQISTNEYIYTILNKKNKNKHTPLHVAIYNGNLNVIKEILKYSHQSVVNACDGQKRTSLHMAAEKGHADILRILLEHDGDAHACDINDWTPLHDASRCSIHQDDNKERTECIEILVNYGKANINALNIRRETPLHIACEYGSKKLIKRLRKFGADLFATNVQGYNCLEVAIVQQNEDVVKYLLDDENGFDLMRNAQIHEKPSSWRSLFGKRYKVDTPMRKLIRKMPKMALYMLNKCSMTVGQSGTSVFKMILVFELLEDQYTVKDWEEGNFGVHKESIESLSTLYTSNKVDLVRNHPLFMMESCEVPDLMSHPVSSYLIKEKFHKFGIFIFGLFVLLYLIYLSLFTTIILRTKDPSIYYNQTNISNFDNSLCFNVSQILNKNLLDISGRKTTIDFILKYFFYIIIWLHILKNILIIIEIIQISFIKTWANWSEMIAVILSFLFIYDKTYQMNLTFRCPYQWQYGAISLLFSWICLLHYIQFIPIIGIYVSVLWVICKKFMKFLIVLIILISGFSFTFYMIFNNFNEFNNVGLSYLKTALMLTGEMTYEDQMYNNDTIAYYKLGHFIYLIFAVLMSILVTNLLIGLAVGDIPPLMKQAKDERNKLFFELVANFEILRYHLSSLFLWYYKSNNDTINYTFQDLNQKTKFQQLTYWLSKFLLGSTNKNNELISNAYDHIKQQTLILRNLRK
ncbi:unnamed protein product [Adineta ricciae]|nr:unnamed protein product [Adineta ricciae]